MLDWYIPYNPEDYRTVTPHAMIETQAEFISDVSGFQTSISEESTQAVEESIVEQTRAENAGAGHSLTLRAEPKEWTKSLETKFSKLVLKEAIEGLSPKERDKLHQFQQDRRRLLNPRSAKEIALDFKRSQATKKLLESIDEYVQVVCGAPLSKSGGPDSLR
jgi:hypothetical protein